MSRGNKRMKKEEKEAEKIKKSILYKIKNY